jgi:fatty-acyl-CoA synthase
MDLVHWIERHAAFNPDKPAIVFAGSEISYAAMAADIRLAIRRLVTLGLHEGEVIAFLGFNHPANLILLFACARIGAILLPLNWRLAAPEHARVLADAAARVIIIEKGFVAHAESLRAGWPDALWLTLESAVPGWSSWQDVEPAATPVGPRDEDAKSDPVLLCYTSGSTGAPKGVVLTQEALLCNALNSTHMHDLTSADRILTTLPLYHVGGLNILTLPALHAGATVELHPRFDPNETFDAVERRRITLTVLVPAQLTLMMEHPRWPQADLSSLRVITTGSTIVSASFVRRMNARGPLLVQVYGSTETSPIATYLRARDAERKAGSAGLPALHCEVRVVDAKGRDLPLGSNGEIFVRGANVMRDYWKRPEQTARVLEGGWYHSGDIGHFDAEGYLYVVARNNDMIISGGENIYPAEVESAICDHPDVAEVAVVGVPDEKWGEAVKAIVVMKPGKKATPSDIIGFARERIAGFKTPKTVDFIEALPRNASGKILRRHLRDPYWLGKDRQVN